MTNAMTAERRHLVLDSDLAELDRLAAAIDALCAGADRAAEAPAFTLCAEELFTNIVVHGHGGAAGHAIDAVLTDDAGTLSIELADDAPAFDPTTGIDPDLSLGVEDRPIGGLGRHLVSTMMDWFCYRRDGDRNRVGFGRAPRIAGERTNGDRTGGDAGGD